MTGTAAQVADLGSHNGTLLGVEPVGSVEQTVEIGTRLEAGRTATLRPAVRRAAQRTQGGGSIRATRPPRRHEAWLPLQLVLPAPPAPVSRPHMPYVATFLPVAVGVATFVGTRNPAFLAFSAPLAGLGLVFDDRRAARRAELSGEGRWRRQLGETLARLGDARRDELRVLEYEAPDVGELVGRVQQPADELWERSHADADTLVLRVGTADRPSRSSVTLSVGGSDVLRATAAAALAPLSTLQDAPVAIDLLAGVVGLCGDRAMSSGVARSLVLQAALLNPPSELLVCAVLPDPPTQWTWLTWLPHSAPEHAPWGGRTLACGVEQASELVAQLAATTRSADRRILLLVDDELGLERGQLTPLLGRAAEMDVAIVWLGRDRRELPGRCHTIIEIPAHRAVARVTAPATTIEDVTTDGIPIAVADRRALAPFVEVGAAGDRDMPPRVALVELLDLDDPSPAASRTDGTDPTGRYAPSSASPRVGRSHST